MSNRRTKDKWLLDFKSTKLLMGTLDMCDTIEEVVRLSTRLRNPIVFDNNVADVKNLLPYSIPNGLFGGVKETDDHLIGISNIVLYIYKNRLHDSWDTVNDFKRTLKSLNVTLRVPKSLNDNGVFKNGWQFGYDTVSDAIRWDLKLKSVGITSLICNRTGDTVSVESVWKKWDTENKKPNV